MYFDVFITCYRVRALLEIGGMVLCTGSDR